MEKVSVIVPVYNGEKCIKRCAESILNQDYPELELILIDDGSRDRSWEIMQAIAAADHRVKAIHQENGGVSSARNRALDEASGTYVQFADADDWLPMDATKLLVREMEAQAAELAVEDTRQLRRQVLDRQARLEIAMRHMLQQRTETLRRLMKSRMLQDPLRITDRAEERLDRALMRMQQTLPRRLENRELRLMQAIKALQHPEKLLLEPERRLQQAMKTLQHPERLLMKPEQRVTAALKALHKQEKLWEPYENRYQNAWNQFTTLAKNLTVNQEQRLALATARLDAVSPLKILSRGYSVTANGQGQIVKSVQDVHWGEEIRTRLSDGEVYSIIQQIDNVNPEADN